MDPALPQFLWLVVAGAFAAFGFGWATGANDVANAFGTSVGAKTLTLRQAVLIAAIFEFVGAMVLGRVSTSTISGGIANTNAFVDEPAAYAYGMVCALAVGFLWQGWACYAGFNVSATHSIIGGIIGFALVWGGGDAVVWAQPDSGSFPPVKGVVPIILSWFFSPILSSIAAAIIFFITRTLVLRHANSFKLAFWVLPPFVFVATFINMFFVFTKGAAKTLGWPSTKSAWVSVIIAAGLSFLSAVIVIPYMKFRFNKHAKAAAEAEAAAMESGKDMDGAAVEPAAPMPTSRIGKIYHGAKTAILHGTSVDIHTSVKEDPLVAALHERAEVFNPQAEAVFGYLQVFSAVCVIFAHGAGEVGYMAGPLGAIWTIYQTGELSKSFTPNGADIWILILSAVALVIGLATYGYNVVRSMGVTLAKLTPSRGFAAELATALVILIASQFGLPTSSSQVITGGIIGVGMCEGIMGVNWKFFVKQFATWMGTLLVVGLGSAAIFAQGVYSPSAVASTTA